VLFFLVSKSIGVPFNNDGFCCCLHGMNKFQVLMVVLDYFFHLSTGFSEAFSDGNIFLNKVFISWKLFEFPFFA